MKRKPTAYHLLIAFIALFAVPGSAIAQIDSLPVHNEQAILLKSKALKEDRTLWVHLPPDYNTTTNTYPVLYLLDGDSHFTQASAAADFLAGYDRNRIPPMIVVAITNVDRGRDFTPVHPQASSYETDSATVLKTSGAGRFLRYIEEEAIPYIDSHYRVAPYRILAGHSLGGLFALYVKETKPDLFPAMIVMSPAINGVNDHMLADVPLIMKTPHPHNGKLFFTLGNENPQKVEVLAAQLKKVAPPWLAWDYRKYDDENHFSLPYKSIFDGLKFIYKDWFIDYYSSDSFSYMDMAKRFDLLSSEFGYKIEPTEDFVNSCGYSQLRAHHLDNAISLFEANVKQHPDSFNAYDSLGEAYMNAGQKELAIKNYKRSLELNPHNDGGREMLKKLEGGKK